MVPVVTRLDDTAEPAAVATPDSVVVIGNFDGVHLGHQAVLAEAVTQAAARGLAPVVLTFDPHPSAVVGGGAPPILTTLPHRAELIGERGISNVYVRRFDLGFAAQSPEEFVRGLVWGTLRARLVSVGENFRFGAKRAGDLAMLRRLGAEMGFETRVHGLARDAIGPFSSSRARLCVASGDVEGATGVLGRPHGISGKVAHGAKRGRTIGVPTANLDEIPEMLPPNGVYAVRVDLLDSKGMTARSLAPGVMNIGVRPTVGSDPVRTAEVHLLDWSGDVYGATLRAHLVARLRDEQRFDGLEALKAQIARDIEQARKTLA